MLTLPTLQLGGQFHQNYNPMMFKALFIGIHLDAGKSGAFNILCEWQLTLLPFLEVFSSIIFTSLLLSLYNAKAATEITLS